MWGIIELMTSSKWEAKVGAEKLKVRDEFVFSWTWQHLDLSANESFPSLRPGDVLGRCVFTESLLTDTNLIPLLWQDRNSWWAFPVALRLLPEMIDYTSDAVYRLISSLVGIEVAGEGSQGKTKGCSVCHWHLKSNSQTRKTKGMELQPGQLENREKNSLCEK